MKTLERVALISVLSGALAWSAGAQSELTDGAGAIKGTMDIDFPTRYQLDADGNTKKGVKDAYKFTFNVAKTMEYSGTIYRVPRLTKEGGLIQGEKETQGNQLEFGVNLSVINPNDPTMKKAVGKWVGVVPIDSNGSYDLAGTEASKHRVQVDAIGKAAAFTENFGGALVGKPRVKKEAKAIEFVRKIADKEVKMTVTNSDPMRFENVTLAMGPASIYPKTVVNGNLDYDYDTGNWLTSGLKFKYSLDGKDFEDVVTGTIKWVEDPNRSSNGKGHYEFNLRFNEAKAAPASTEADAFAKMSDEEAFFAVDNSIPALTGSIEYTDVMDGKGRVTQSKVAYNLNANKLTKQQIVNFFKLWMICVGPTNDE